jgi:FlaA1/EpsC-like NDP-sugar epimerase
MLEFRHNLIIRLFALESFKKRLVLIIFDGSVASISLLLAFFIRLEATDFLHQVDTFVGVLIATTTALSVFAARGLYNNITRHISSDSVYNIAIGSVISCSILLSSILLFTLAIPRSVPIIYAMLLCLFATAIRFFIRALGKKISKEKRQNIAVYGTGPDSVQLAEALQKNSNYRVRLLIGDNPKMNGKTVGGVTIYNLAHAAQKIKQLEIKVLLMTESSDIAVIRDRILEVLSEYPLKIKKIPNISNLISGKTNITEMVDIKIEELLGRKPAVHSSELMAKSIAGKTILVTGAGGSIGSELCRQIVLWKPEKLLLLDISEYSIYQLLKEFDQHPNSNKCELVPLIGSVQDRQFIEKVFNHFAIDTTYHAAAYKHVPLMEQNVMQCFANNVFGTLNLVEVAIETNVENFVLISTDKAVNPTNFMGASKRFAEIICQSLPTKETETRFSIVRFGNVLGSSGSVVPLFKSQIERGGPITLTHLDITRYFMTISEASQLVIQAGSFGKGGKIFVLDMGEPVKIFDLAKRMAALSGLKPILNGKERLESDEIAIIVTGLRPGEKLFEELVYSSNLSGTIHPQINTTEEVPMSHEALQELLLLVGDAIRDNEYQKLYTIVSKVAEGVADLEHSCDVFIERHDGEGKNIVPLSRQTKLN